ncbi:PhzF family phenazine biosynthesis protein [Blastococcus sp. SYSU DS0973]
MAAPVELDYEVVDVFAGQAFAGNPLAVVFDADGLTTAQCQALANEFHLSETSFLSAPTEPDADRPGSAAGPQADYRVRIFTPFAELPFAGHPSVGAAHTLVRTGRLPAGTLRQECGAGVLDLVVDANGATLSGGRPALQDGPAPAELAAALGLAASDATGMPADVAGCGLPFAYLSVSPEAVDRAVPDRSLLAGLDVGEGISVLSWDAASATARARVFAADLGWGEDPATGSAALGTGVWLVRRGLLAGGGTSSYTVRQGERLGRPSVLECTVTAAGRRAVAATVRGAVVPIARGRIRVPLW